MERYKEDSTKGTSLIDPRKYKGDALVQVWMDSRVLATLSRWLDTKGSYTRFLSEVVKDSLQTMCDHLVDGGEVELMDDTVEARALLEMKYRINLNPNRRGEKNKLHNIVLSDRRKSLKGKMEVKGVGGMSYIPMDGGVRGYTQEELELALAEADEKIAAEKKVIIEEEKEKAIEEGKNNPNFISEEEMKEMESNSSDDRARKMTNEELDRKAIELERKDKETLKELNKPIDVEDVKKNVVGEE